MKRFSILLLVIAFLTLTVSPVLAKIRTENVDIDSGQFQYKVAYVWATKDVAASLTAVKAGNNNSVFYEQVVPFVGSIIGIGIMTSEADKTGALTAGSATAEVTINGNVTGVKAGLHYPTYTRANYYNLEYEDDSPSKGGGYHSADYSEGKATTLVAGDRIGVKITTTSTMTPANTDFTVVVNVMQ